MSEWICWESEEKEKSKVNNNTIPNNPKCRYDKKKCINTHEYYNFSDSISYLVVTGKMMKIPNNTKISDDKKKISIRLYVSCLRNKGKLSKKMRELRTNPFGKVIKPHKNHRCKSSNDEAIFFSSRDKCYKTWYQSKKKISYVGKFSRLILLESKIRRKLQIVIESFFISKISSHIFILTFSVSSHEFWCTSLSFFDFFFRINFSIIVHAFLNWSSKKVAYSWMFDFRGNNFVYVFDEPWYTWYSCTN